MQQSKAIYTQAVIKKNDIVGYRMSNPLRFDHYGIVVGLIAAGTHPAHQVMVKELVRDVCLRKSAGYGDPGQYTWRFQTDIWPIDKVVVVDHINDLLLLEKLYE